MMKFVFYLEENCSFICKLAMPIKKLLLTIIIILHYSSSMGYGDLSHTKVVIFHKAKLSRIYKTEVWDKSHIPLLVVSVS